MLRNTTKSWGWPSIALHWIGALAILVLLLHGWWMTHMVARPERLANYAWHSALGYDLMALLVLRLLWRWINPVPAQPVDSKPWERRAAQLGHIGLYVLMVVVSLTGWITATTFRTPITRDLFGIQVPALVTSVERSTRNLVEETHLVLAYVLAAVVAIHVVGALRHHFVKHNDVFRRMIAPS
jgi:cytochrome b561